MNTKINCQNLIDKYLANTISKEELNQLLLIVKEADGIEILTAALKNHWETAKQIDAENKPYWDKKFATILEEASNFSPIIEMHPEKKLRRLSRTIVAAAMLLVLVGGVYVYLNIKANQPIKDIISKTLNNDVLPGGNKAFLTLSNGTNIILDSATNGILAQQGRMNIVKLSSGQLIYKTNDNLKTVHEVQFNTLRTPRGGQYQLTLSDGTEVWLNSASSIHFPTSFSGDLREVTLTGEAYFEVAKNKEKPFQVKVGAMKIAVLGTHFNVNAYEDESETKTSLLEGSVQITQGNVSGLLKPGQQAVVNNKSDKIKIGNVDLTEVMAWKNGLFWFEGADIKTIMREIGRWYDVEIVYAGKVPNHRFVGKINRNVELSEVLRILELSNVKFSVAGKKIIVQ